MQRNHILVAFIILLMMIMFGWIFVSKKSSTLPIFSAKNCIGTECLQITQLTPPVADAKTSSLILKLHKMTYILLINAKQTSDRYPKDKNFLYLYQSELRNLSHLEDLMNKYSLLALSINVDEYLPQHPSLYLAYQKTQMYEESRQKVLFEEILPFFDQFTDLGRIAKQIYTESYYYDIPTLRRLIQVTAPTPTLSQ